MCFDNKRPGRGQVANNVLEYMKQQKHATRQSANEVPVFSTLHCQMYHLQFQHAVPDLGKIGVLPLPRSEKASHIVPRAFVAGGLLCVLQGVRKFGPHHLANVGKDIMSEKAVHSENDDIREWNRTNEDKAND